MENIVKLVLKQGYDIHIKMVACYMLDAKIADSNAIRHLAFGNPRYADAVVETLKMLLKAEE
jgi:hypothetical protein